MDSRFLSELLLKHDCVIIPGLGGFVANPEESYFDNSRKMLHPPSRTIAFNANLKLNDGLLADYISRKENISYAESCRAIMQWVEKVISDVTAGNRFRVEQIGSFYLNHEKVLQFSPDRSQNYLTSSFGLKPVIVPGVKGKRIKLKFNPVSGEPRKINRKSEWISVAAVLALCLMIWASFPRYEIQLAALLWQDNNKNVFSHNSAIIENSNPSQEVFSNSVHLTEENHPAISDERFPVRPGEDKKVPESDSEVISKPSDNNQAEDIHESPGSFLEFATTRTFSYFIIVGCFRIEENAGKLVAGLNASGLKSEIIGKTPSGLTMVSAGSYQSLNEADQALLEMKSQLPDGGWIYKKVNQVN
ncbi:MAG: SPOR domain-containing protein [Bacteroidia bacterium]|nr:SPOR domain-containing protein [Bacteroidia bacterium]MCZ2276726.1 SPOR domain-containing protein [Bacteroidia bacterium]